MHSTNFSPSLSLFYILIDLSYDVSCRSGHHLGQENKASILDLMDALCCPDEEYFGLRYTFAHLYQYLDEHITHLYLIFYSQ